MNASPRKRTISWALYDLANSAFATTVMAGFFPIFFKQYWSQDAVITESTFYLGIGNSLASLVIVILAPILGAMADTGGLRKRMLAGFASLGILATGALYLVQAGMWPFAILLYAIAVIGFSGANTFYDALLVIVAPPNKRHRVSALGFALGYLGGGILFLVNVLMTLKPHAFGLADAAEGVRWSFISVAVWWTLFSIPLFLFVEEPLPKAGPRRVNFQLTFTALATTARSISQYRNAWIFLLAYWLYIDGVDTIVRMSVDFGLSIGLSSDHLITALLLVQFIGFPAALVFGRLGERYGAKRGIWICVWVYVGVTIYAFFMETALQMYILAAVIGLVQGGIQALSRSMFSRLIPSEKNAEFFGFYNVVGKAAAVFGPVMMGTIAHLSGNPRLGILSIALLFFAGMFFFRLVKDSY
ncbi:MFS transporter [Gammaproteobacteria bacterium]|nr:MFS transporter [Gammaproteobacteria bacterium]